MVMVNARPAIAEAGLRLVIAGGGEVMVNAAPAEVPPAEMTVIFAVPAVATRLDETVAVNCLALLQAVFGAIAPQIAVEVEVKLLPLIVSVNAAAPAVIELGLRVVTAGGVADAGGANAKASVTEKTSVNRRKNERALCI